jgi:hypothetical protein
MKKDSFGYLIGYGRETALVAYRWAQLSKSMIIRQLLEDVIVLEMFITMARHMLHDRPHWLGKKRRGKRFRQSRRAMSIGSLATPHQVPDCFLAAERQFGQPQAETVNRWQTSVGES